MDSILDFGKGALKDSDLFSPLLLDDLVDVENKKAQLKAMGLEEQDAKKEAKKSISDDDALQSTDIESQRSSFSIGNLSKRRFPASSSGVLEDLQTELLKGNVKWSDLVITPDHLKIMKQNNLLEL